MKFLKKIWQRKNKTMGLLEELSERNTVYNQMSEKILVKYSDILDEVFEYVSQSTMDIKWFNMDFHPSNNKLLAVVGLAKHKIGDTVATEEGEVTYVDETNVNNYAKPLRLILPLKSLDAMNLEENVTFIEEYSKLSYKLYPDDIEGMIGEDSFLELLFSAFGGSLDNLNVNEPEPIKTPQKPQLTNKKKGKEVVQGFDISDLDLDEIQIQQLKMFDGTKS